MKRFFTTSQIAILMLRFGFLLFVFCFVANARAQKIDSDFFLGDEWAIRNGDSLFFKSDTLRMIKLAKRQSKQSRNIAVNLADYYKTDFVTLGSLMMRIKCSVCITIDKPYLSLKLPSKVGNGINGITLHTHDNEGRRFIQNSTGRTGPVAFSTKK